MKKSYLDDWKEEKLSREDWKDDSSVFLEEIKLLSYKVFFENDEGAQWLRMMEHQYMTNPLMGTDIDHDSMVLKEGVKMVIRAVTEYAREYANPQKDESQEHPGKHIRRGRK